MVLKYTWTANKLNKFFTNFDSGLFCEIPTRRWGCTTFCYPIATIRTLLRFYKYQRKKANGSYINFYSTRLLSTKIQNTCVFKLISALNLRIVVKYLHCLVALCKAVTNTHEGLAKAFDARKVYTMFLCNKQYYSDSCYLTLIRH